MDSITHALTGAVIAKAIDDKKIGNWGTIAGLAMGFFPDSDFVLGLLNRQFYLEYHRDFTHSLLLLPFYALLFSWLFVKISKRHTFWSFYKICLPVLVSHVILDLLTSYGTMIFSPFFEHRFSWDLVFIIDLIFSGIVFFPLMVSIYWKNKARWICRGSLIGLTLYILFCWVRSTKSPAQSLNLAIKYLEKAAALTDRKGIALTFLGHVYALKKDYDKSIELEQQAIALIPNGADAHMFLAITLNWAGRPEEALPLLEKAMRLNPLPPAFYYLHVGTCYRLLGRFEDAIAMFKKSIQLAPNSALAYRGLACTYGQMGREAEAKAAAAELLRINPKFTVEYALKTSPFKDTDQIEQGLRKAGLK